MAWLQKDLDICQEALYLLRQDVDVPALSDVDSDSTLECRPPCPYTPKSAL